MIFMLEHPQNWFYFSRLWASAQVDDFKNPEKRLPLAAENLDSRGLYLYDDVFRFNTWFGRALSPDVAMNLLGADFAAELSKVWWIP